MNSRRVSTDSSEVRVRPWCWLIVEGFSNNTIRRSMRMATSLGFSRMTGTSTHSRLLCGDAGPEADLDRLLGGVTVDLLLTDPLYTVAT
jgi:hypothetical protein